MWLNQYYACPMTYLLTVFPRNGCNTWGRIGSSFQISKTGVYSQSSEDRLERMFCPTGPTIVHGPLVCETMPPATFVVTFGNRRLYIARRLWQEGSDCTLACQVLVHRAHTYYTIAGINFARQVRTPRAFLIHAFFS